MYGLRSAQGRARVAILVLLVLLGSVAAAAAWRAQTERAMHQSLEDRSNVVAAVEKARAEFLRGATLITAAVFSEDAIPFIDSYRQANAERDEQLFRARVALTALGDTDALAALDSCTERLEQTKAKIEAIVSFAATADVSTRIGLAQQQYAPLWAETQAQLAELDELANGQEAALVAERAAADSTAEATFALMLGLSAFAFLGGAATLSVLVVSVVRPLASLQKSARAVAAGNLEARAKVAGPEEVASLAQDFNQMIAERKRVEEALRESETKYRHIFESIQDIFYRTDAEGIIIEISPSVERFGYTREQLVGTQVLEVYEDPEERSGLLKALLEQGEVADHEIRLKTGDGRLVSTSVSAHILRGPDGTPIGIEGTLRDISDRKAAEEALRESEERFRLAINATKDGLWEWDIQTNQEFFSPRWCEIIGYSFDDPDLPHTYESWASRIHPDDYDRVVRAMTNHLEKGTRYDVDYRHRHKSGEYRWQNSKGQAVLDESGKPIKMIGCISDISDRKAAEEALREQARRDPLTGVLNHGAIVDEMRSLISAGGHATPWAVAMIDVNRLKVMNDTYGHQVGDAVLVAVAAALSRDDVLVGRYGGDEFVAILPTADKNAAERYRKDATDALAHATITDPQTGASVRAEASIGLAIYPEDGSTLADLIKFSDSAMYAAKRQRHDRRRSPRKHAPDRKAA